MAPFKSPQPQIQRYKDTVLSVLTAEVGAEVPGHGQIQLTQTLIAKNHFSMILLDCEKITVRES